MVGWLGTIALASHQIMLTISQFTFMMYYGCLLYTSARDEHPEHTGFAHLFEHLMFGGSAHIPDYDTPLQLARCV